MVQQKIFCRLVCSGWFGQFGGWVSYALGSENDNLPAFVSIPDPRGIPQSSVNNWGQDSFLPISRNTIQASKPLLHLNPPAEISTKQNQAARSLLRRMNARHLDKNPGDGKLAARIASYELAAKMQLSVPKSTT